MRIAAAQYPIELLASWDAYRMKLESWVGEAAGNGAELLLFPEYGGMELASLLDENSRGDLKASIEGMKQFVEPFLELHAELARRYGVHIAAASLPVGNSVGQFHNVTHLFSPDGPYSSQEKIVMTRFERELWGIEGGNRLRLFETDLGPIGIAICYDVEFPLLVHRLCDSGARLILVPSCTDAVAGYSRVNIACRARAIENQCYVAMAPTVGEAPWSPAVDVNVGAAGVYAPPDRGLPDTGIIAEGALNGAQWLYADIDFTHTERVRRDGQVLNSRDWAEQEGLGRAERVQLSRAVKSA
ncbi:MAG TPA: carbon-nitrogen hydrolase family protein [Alphaproteobacteria bacterium]|nr:carbon-nitrogen hydrolase family protein [Alphaproteobacteria bacterium]